ncbi:GNAT family N-acetyltransferase [Algoriphagus limi]|uniref:GNAT family N-acetyltransferase n=1 Tax=Algoriphagus limi TaxID=2975273 RepID=A0ABT2G1B3_9BACT|nr:GNAT family N-acetyltransferase [Algoriphagus limi]MCS5489054.1 GNAT family N-acetyltransferase [Algoriphagus limi]
MIFHLPKLGEVKLIPIQSTDQPRLFSLMSKIYKEAYRYIWVDDGDWYLDLIYCQKTLDKELCRERSHYFFVEVNGKKAGIFKYDYPFSPRETEIPNALKIHRLYLDADYHGTGLGKFLMEYGELVAKENGLENLWLEAMACQPQALRFYEKMGYQIVHSYVLPFERILPEYRLIHIMKKEVKE